MKILNKNLSKKGFTLAEMLIVIAVIGIVAAVSIPIVIANSQKTQFVSALQKTTNVFTNAANRAQVSGESIDSWDYSLSASEFANRYLTSYLNIIKSCDTTDNGCFAENYIFADGSDATAYTAGGDNYKFILADGTSVALKLEASGDSACTTDNPSICARLIVDVNGLKTPNKWGKDVFEFQILGNLATIVPAGSFSNYDSDTNRWTFNEPSAINEGCIKDGKLCAAKIVNDGWEMNY